MTTATAERQFAENSGSVNLVACSVPGCDREVSARALCHAHYERRRLGRPVGGPIPDSPLARFMAKVTVSGTCWLWTGATDGGGRYGLVYFDGRKRPAHRVSLALHGDSLPDRSDDVDHLCRTTLCVRPDHLQVVPHVENVHRGAGVAALNARKTHCLRGHEFTPENTLDQAGGRTCRTCREIRNAMRRGEPWAIEAWNRRLIPLGATRPLSVVEREARARLAVAS